MIKKLLTAAAACAALTGGAAHASTVYDFSYIFSDGQQITGSLTGTSTNGGQSVSNISNLQLSFNGIAFTGGVGPLQLNAWNTTTESFTDTTPVTIYSKGALNNFAISDVDAAVNTSPDYEFSYINDPTVGSEVVAANYLHSDSFSGAGATQLDIDAPANAGSWTLNAAPVPLPAALPLLASGLGGLGIFGIGRRRTAR